MGEADVHLELRRHLRNAIEDRPDRGRITYGTARPEYDAGSGGRADVVVFDADADPVFVVEAKRPGDGGSRDVDPYAPAVVRQAFRYADALGAPFCCTCNRDRLVVFDASTEGVPLLERSTKSYAISDVAGFADALLDEIARLRAGDARWDAPDTAFVDRVHSLHDRVSPRLQSALAGHLADDADFRESFAAWTAAQGIEYERTSASNRRAVRRGVADQAAYLLVNEILFSKLLEDAPTSEDTPASEDVPTSEDTPASEDAVDPLAAGPLRVQDGPEDDFRHLVETADFEASYGHDPIYGEIPLDPVEEELREFAAELDERDLTRFDGDVVGRIYEGVIPPERRREMGEYYTPPAICDLITRLTVTEASDTVLDPACGSGGFLVSAYHRIREQLPDPTGSHDGILGQLSGVEINRFPAHLTAINLAIQGCSHPREVDVAIDDFFDVTRPQRFGRERAGAEGGEADDEGESTGRMDGFDAVVGNPPYVRQENIDDKDHVRDHLDGEAVDAEYVSRRSDVYTYFLTHGTEFLAEGGDLGFVTSDRWLDTQYGEDVQRFVLDNYRIRAIVTFDRQVFDDALVDSSVLVLRKEGDEDERDGNVAKFIRLKAEMDVEEIASLVEDDYEANRLRSADEYRLVTRKQSALYHEPKWNVFFLAPPVYFDVVADPNVVELAAVADVSRGVTTGANAFFAGHTEDMNDLGLEPYTTSLLKATGQVDTIPVTDDVAEEWSILDVHGLVRRALDDGDGDSGRSDAERVKEWLRDNDHRALLEYVRSGEDEGYHERSTLQSRDVWFDLGELPRPHVFSTMFTWRVHRVYRNDPGAAPSDQFYCISPESGVDEEVLAGVLNSRLVWLANELRGRRAGGQGMTRLQTKVYETETWPVPDPREMAESRKEQIRAAFDALVEREREVAEATREATEAERDALDRAVLSTLDLEGEQAAVLDELKRGVRAMVDVRDAGAGQRTTVLVERERRVDGETGAIELPGVEDARERTTPDDR